MPPKSQQSPYADLSFQFLSLYIYVQRPLCCSRWLDRSIQRERVDYQLGFFPTSLRMRVIQVIALF